MAKQITQKLPAIRRRVMQSSKDSAKSTLSYLPEVISAAGPKVAKAFLEFFAATIRNKNTREAYLRDCSRFFAWCQEKGIAFEKVEPMFIAAYIEQMALSYPSETIKQHLSAIKKLFDFLVIKQMVPMNPAASVKGPRVNVSEGKTPTLTAEEARALLSSIDTSEVRGMRDRAIMALMLYTFARVGAVTKLKVSDFHRVGDEWHVRLREKGSKQRDLPVHPEAAGYMKSYLRNAGLSDSPTRPFFQTTHGRSVKLSGRAMHRTEILRMIKRRTLAADLSPKICCHSFRATGITRYMDNGGRIEHAQRIAGHADARTTKLYDRSDSSVRIEELKKIEF